VCRTRQLGVQAGNGRYGVAQEKEYAQVEQQEGTKACK
jgi:hypothetical protein